MLQGSQTRVINLLPIVQAVLGVLINWTELSIPDRSLRLADSSGTYVDFLHEADFTIELFLVVCLLLLGSLMSDRFERRPTVKRPLNDGKPYLV